MRFTSLVIFLFVTNLINAQIVFNNSITKSGSGVSSLTYTKTIAAGSNRLLYVGVTTQDKNISSVTYTATGITTGTSLTTFTTGTRNSMMVGMYYAALGTNTTAATTATIKVTFSGGTDAFSGAADYSGVWQSPSFINPAVRQAKSTAPSVTVTSTAGNLAVSLMGDISATPTGNGSGQTQYWSFSGSHSNRSTSAAGASTVAMSHTINASEDWVMIGATMLDYAVTLPIELINFRWDYLPDKSIQLVWETASETNNAYFEIEKSSDGINFNVLDRVNSKAFGGNSTQILSYSYIDNINTNDITYYRLKQVDLDMSFTYSEIISVVNDSKNNVSFKIFPNPNKGEFDIDFSGIENNHTIEISMFNQLAQLVYFEELDANSIIADNPMFHVSPKKYT